MFSDLVMMKYLAFGLLIALLLDATIVRMFLVPAIMKLLGDDCWWAPKWMKRLQHKIGLGETTLPDERKRPVLAGSQPRPATAAASVPAGGQPARQAAPAGPAVAVTEPVDAPAAEAPTTRFAAAKAEDDRDIGSWLGELRRKTSRRGAEADSPKADPSAQPPKADPSAQPTRVIPSPGAPDDATTAIPTAPKTTPSGPPAPSEAPTAAQISAEETRAIPVSRPEAVDSEVATEQLNARGKKGGGVSAQDLLRREGRL